MDHISLAKSIGWFSPEQAGELLIIFISTRIVTGVIDPNPVFRRRVGFINPPILLR